MKSLVSVGWLIPVWVWNWITSINPTVAASLIALIGVSLSLLWNRREQRRQQFLELRRGIFLEAAEAYADGMEYLALLSQPDVTRARGHVVLGNLSRVVAKINIVARQVVLESVTRLHAEYMQDFRALIVTKDEVDELWERLAENAGIIQRAIQMLQTPPPNPLEIFQRIETLQEENRGIQSELTRLRWRLIDQWNERFPRLAPYVTEVVLAMKRELGIDIEEKKYAAMNSEAFSTHAQRVQEHLAAIRNAEGAVAPHSSAEHPKRPNHPSG